MLKYLDQILINFKIIYGPLGMKCSVNHQIQWSLRELQKTSLKEWHGESMESPCSTAVCSEHIQAWEGK